jgi:hypothetical protein
MGREIVPRGRAGSRSPEQAQKIAGLTEPQLRAVELLVQGGRPGAVADKVGVARETLWRWRKLAAFKDQLVRLRYELHAARVDRIWALTDKAYDVVEEHLDEGDPRVANRPAAAGRRAAHRDRRGGRAADRVAILRLGHAQARCRSS